MDKMAAKCSRCGADNRDGVWLCQKCGRLLAIRKDAAEKKTIKLDHPARNVAGTTGDSRPKGDDYGTYKSIPGKMRLDYLHGISDSPQKCLDGLQSLIALLRKPQMKIDDLLQESANLISKQLGIDNVSIGLRDPKDGLYRYKVMVGFRDDAIAGHKRIAYTRDQFFTDGHFIGSDISKYSRLYLAEDNVLTEEERKTFNRPGLLAMKRATMSDSLEGDYIDTKIFGANDELLGWIEISGTRLMKLPDASAIRWVEVVASTIGLALMLQDGVGT